MLLYQIMIQFFYIPYPSSNQNYIVFIRRGGSIDVLSASVDNKTTTNRLVEQNVALLNPDESSSSSSSIANTHHEHVIIVHFVFIQLNPIHIHLFSVVNHSMNQSLQRGYFTSNLTYDRLKVKLPVLLKHLLSNKVLKGSYLKCNFKFVE